MIKIQEAQMSFLKFFYASIMVKNRAVAEKLEEISNFKYRHMVWAMQDAQIDGEDFNMNILPLDELKVNNTRELFAILVKDLEDNLVSLKGDTPTERRFRSDDEYFLEVVKTFDLDEKITAFNEKRKLEGINLEEAAANALIFFLMEESFKEYELITIYSYLKVHSDEATANSTFTDLAYDSIYHFKRFASMAAEMGILTLVRSIPEDKYKGIGIVEFLKENIEEELDAEKQCLILAEKIGNKNLSDFLLFISRQEVYHAELLERALKSINK
jgi:rubrerythrin